VVSEQDDKMSLEKVGDVTFSGMFKAGIDETHGDFLSGHNTWSTFQTWQAARKSGEYV